jgi:hypothetical protein
MKKPLLLILVSILIVSVWSWKRTEAPRDHPTRLLTDRLWIDHAPRSDTDTINIFIARSRLSIGFFEARSGWHGAFDAFRFEASGADLRIVFPRTGTREAIRATARRCAENNMDYCLDIEGASKGVKRYYSQDGWEIRPNADPQAVKQRIEALTARHPASE